MTLTPTAEKLAKILNSRGAGPFLFLGSGFSRRYLNLENWAGLLQRFCEGIKDFGYYSTKANGDLPIAATLIAQDFNELWWSADRYSDSRAKHKDALKTEASSLKLEISLYLNEIDLKQAGAEGHEAEITALKGLHVDGIITTNWDRLLEELFPDYRTFVGQEQLLFANPQSIAEIYKIHGCASDPESLTLTDEDYRKFAERNPYLAAKLITIFVEHPIVFMGYSITDPHIQAIISDISRCLGPERLEQLQNNLIFVVRSNGEDSTVGQGIMTLGETNINFTLVSTDNFLEVFSAIDTVKRQVPARILRFLKEQMYELVKSANPEEKMSVVDIDEIQDKDDVEFVVGVGVAEAHRAQVASVEEAQADTLSKLGYRGISVGDIIADVVKEGSAYNPEELLRLVYPALLKLPNKYIPVFRYLRAAGITSTEELEASDFNDAQAIAKRSLKNGFSLAAYRGQFERDFAGLTTAEIIAKTTPEKVTIMIPHQPRGEVDLHALRDFLHNHADQLEKDPYKSFFRKLYAYYDYLAYGFEL